MFVGWASVEGQPRGLSLVRRPEEGKQNPSLGLQFCFPVQSNFELLLFVVLKDQSTRCLTITP